MDRKKRSQSEIESLLRKYQESGGMLSKVDFCRREGISTACFYRHWKIFCESATNRAIAPVGGSKVGNFVELKPATGSRVQNLIHRIHVRLLGLKLFSVELEHV